MPHPLLEDALAASAAPPARAPAACPSCDPAPSAAVQRAASPAARPADLLTLQRAVGNAATRGLLGGGVLQTKLTLGPPGDAYEQEADRVARQVVSSLPAAGEVQRTPEEDEEEMGAMPSVMAKRLQREGGVDVGPVDPAIESSIQGARGGGAPLDAGVRGPMESAFGADFSGVRVHTDARAHALNDAVQARAFTTETDVFFRSGEYDPGSSAGKELLAHELTHVVQQVPGVAAKRR